MFQPPLALSTSPQQPGLTDFASSAAPLKAGAEQELERGAAACRAGRGLSPALGGGVAQRSKLGEGIFSIPVLGRRAGTEHWS